MNELKQRFSENLEVQKQAKKDIQKRLDGNIQPKKNHIVFEINVCENTIIQAVFDKNITITFAQAVSERKENKSITRKKDCIYISAMNKKNALKILKRDFNISW